MTELKSSFFTFPFNGEEKDAVAISYQENQGTQFFHVSIYDGKKGLDLHLQCILDENGVLRWVDKYTLESSTLTGSVGTALEQHFG